MLGVMLELGYDYATCIRNSEKVAWTIDEVMPPGTQLDFSRPFLPPLFCGEREIGFLQPSERLQLNHITGNAYINLFAFVEEYLIATAVEHAQAEMYGDHTAIRALLRFAEEEVKHQMLFKRFGAVFSAEFGSACGLLDNAAEVAGVILSKTPIAVMMITLHLEIMTQAHYTESIRDSEGLDPLFTRLLKHHWLEEAQHAKIDALELDKLIGYATPPMIEVAFADYLDLCTALDGLLATQAGMDVDSLVGASGRDYGESERAEILAQQHAAYRRTFLIAGMTNRQFVGILGQLSPQGAAQVAERAESLR